MIPREHVCYFDDEYFNRISHSSHQKLKEMSKLEEIGNISSSFGENSETLNFLMLLNFFHRLQPIST